MTTASRISQSSTAPDEPIAVIGMSCRLPDAPGPAEFWQLLVSGGSAISELPPGRWDAGDAHVQGGFLPSVDGFDAAFFGISPREAVAMDPQQRLVLELGWESLEDARIVPATLRGSRAGVYVGAIWDDYAAAVHRSGGASIGHHTMTGLHRGMIANRLSYALGLRGPSVTVDSAQSSALVAVHLAAESLRRGEAEITLAGGVNLILDPFSMTGSEQFGGLSPDGRCYTFDDRANGYVRGEGGGFVVLKPLAAARADGDRVHAVILGGTVNNDGATDGLTVPGVAGQMDVLRRAYERAGVDPSEVGYVELHGSGTPVGDPVEAAALGAICGTGRPPLAPLLVGSAKTNVGHLEGAAGIVGLLKTVLSLRHGQVPPSLNFQTPNQRIPMHELGLRVVQETTAWPATGGRRYAGVSSFGMGGTNCHLVLADAGDPVPETGGAPVEQAPVVFALSAKTEPALREQAAQLLRRLEDHPELALADLAHTLATARTAFTRRAAISTGDRDTLAAALHAAAAGRPHASLSTGVARAPGRIVFVFPGQGSQWAGMGLSLYQQSPVFAGHLDACDRAIAAHTGWSVLDVLRQQPGTPLLDDLDVVQPALFAVMVALARLWQHHGIQPDAVTGHSQGEIAAAHIAGALSLHDAAHIVVTRARLVARLGGTGTMASIGLPAADLDLDAWPGLSVAAHNGPTTTVVAGAPDDVVAFMQHVSATTTAVHVKQIAVTYASHSSHMEQLRDELVGALAIVEPGPAGIPLYSTTTASLVADTRCLTAEHWYQNLRRPVLLHETITALAEAGHTTYIEVSPHPVLIPALTQTLESACPGAHITGSLHRNHAATGYLSSLAEHWTHGTVEAAPAEPARHVDLPTYPFQRKRYWLDGAAPVQHHVVVDVAPPAEVAAEFTTALAHRLSGLSPVEADTVCAELVRDNVAAVQGLETGADVEAEQTFKDLGLDSVMSVELSNRLGAATGIRLPSSALFDYPTPLRLARHLRVHALGGTDDAGHASPARLIADEPLAVVAMGCRYPGGITSPEDLWDLVLAQGEGQTGFPTDRGWSVAGAPAGMPRTGGFLPDAAEFDAAFFGISPREATAMDPQQRLLLETAWETFERAGIDPATLRGGPTGVFVGATSLEYGPRLSESRTGSDGHLLTGNTTSVASGRIAYTFGFEGPAVTIDTACSSSLVALHLAAQALRTGECDMALAGGVAVMSTPGMFVEFARQGGLATDGRCKPFATAADGTAWSEGVGLLLVERLSDAQRNGHPILAVVRGSAVNQDGASNGLTAPNGPSQQRVIRQALTAARLNPADVDVVEAHGTGTTLGDPIEAQALLATYGQDRPDEQPLWLGSVKSNIGHTQAAAGVAGIIKMVLAMQHGVLPRTLHIDAPTHHVDWGSGQVRLLQEPTPWTTPEQRPRRAGVSSFGISGTNAHVILEQAPTPEPQDPQPAPKWWPLSAKTPAALDAVIARLAEHRAAHPDRDPADIAYTLHSRETFTHRAAVTPDLRTLARAETRPGKVAVMFTGQGSQWAGMGAHLYRQNAVFAAAVDELAGLFNPHLPADLRDVMFSEPALLDETLYTQPALFTLQTALYRHLHGLGLRPGFLIGHSIGEITAAHIAGVLSLVDACTLITARAHHMHHATPGGAMYTIQATEAEVRATLPADGSIAIAALNAPGSTAITGDHDAVTALAGHWQEQGRKTRRLQVSHAFHSPHMDEALGGFRAVAETLTYQQPAIPVVSNLTGRLATGDELLTGDYWAQQLRHTVRFHDGISTLAEHGVTTYLEIGPDNTLSTLTGLTLDEPATVSTSHRKQPDHLDVATATLWTLGALPTPSTPGRLTELPTYPFQRDRYWIDTPVTAGGTPAEGAFWVAVAAGDTATLADRLSLDGDHRAALELLLPSVAGWYRGQQARSALDALRYEVRWKRVEPAPAPRLSGTWVVVTPPGLTGDPTVVGIVRALTRQGASAVAAPANDWARIRAEHGAVAGVLSVLTLADAEPAPGAVLPAGAAATLDLARAVLADPDGARLWCVTRGAVGTGPADAPTSPGQALLWGLGRVAALEHPRTWGGLIDLGGGDEAQLTRLAEAVAGDEDQVAVRAGGTFVRRLVHSASPGSGRSPGVPRGTVVITGGTGALGVRVARHLATRGAEHLVLASRRGATAPQAAELAAELAGLGTRVTHVACDLADPAAVDLLDAAVPADLPLTAVIHAAGVADPVLLADTGPGRMAEVLAAKVIGATLVEALLDRHPAATAVHFSSVSAAWGVRSHGPYAAANAYLDAHAQRLTGQGRSVSAIAWGPWAGGGMAADTFGETVRGNGVPELAPDSALAVLDDVLGAAPANVVVTELDWELFAPRFTVNRASALFDDIPAARAALATTDPGAAASTADALRHSLAGLRPQEQKRTILDLVRRAAATVLGHDAPGRIEPRRSFTDIGFDSLTAVEFRNKLMSVTGLTLATTVVFDHPTVYDLAAALHTRLVPLDQQAGAADPADDDIRQRLATVPLTALREAGLLDALLALSGTGHESSQMSSGDSGAIDEMDLDGLLRMALNNGS